MGSRVGIAKPGTPYEPGRLLDLRAGINNSLSDEFIANNELADARNYVPDYSNAGIIIKRLGLTRQLETAQSEPFTSIHEGVITNYFTTSTKIKQFTSDTAITTLGAAATAPDWTSLGGMDVYVDGVNAPQKITAGPVGAALGGSPPTFKFIEAYSNMLHGAGHLTGTIRHTDVGTTETWPSANAHIVTNNQNDDITGMRKFRDVLMVFCAKSFHHFRGFHPVTDFNLTYSSFEEGCTSHRSIVVTPYGIFWWSKVGIVWSTDGFAIDYPMLRKMSKTLDTLSKAFYGSVHAAWHPRLRSVQFWVAVGTSSTPNLRIDFYPETDALFLHDGKASQMGASGRVTISGSSDIYIGSAAASGYLYKQDGNFDDKDLISGFVLGTSTLGSPLGGIYANTPIHAWLKTKRDTTEFGQMAVKRNQCLVPVIFVNGSGTITYGVYVDNSDTLAKSWPVTFSREGFILGTSTLGNGKLGARDNQIVESVIGFGRRFRKIQHFVSDDTTSRNGVRGIVNKGYIISL